MHNEKGKRRKEKPCFFITDWAFCSQCSLQNDQAEKKYLQEFIHQASHLTKPRHLYYLHEPQSLASFLLIQA